MIFVDRVQINVIAGHGGAGRTSFRREKFVPKGGPDGGDGGRGGDVIFKAVFRLQTLMDVSLRPTFQAKHGADGGRKQMFGLNGVPTIIEVPCGTVILDESGTLLADLTVPEQTWVAARGGKGGRGNVHFATSVNQTPRYAQPGLPGESRRLTLELRLLAEVGLIGLPNAGKSTLLSTLTRANPKIADYPFTTLYPNLGVLKFDDREIILADIPGLIEGASEGHGLGAEFLRHVDRTRLLIHLVSVEAETPQQCWDNYVIVTRELEKSRLDLSSKPCLVALNKIDLIDDSTLAEYRAIFVQNGITPLLISGVAHMGISNLITSLLALLHDNPPD